MKKSILTLAIAVGIVCSGFAQSSIVGVVNKGATGTTSATVFIPPSNGFTEITHLSYKLDAGVTTGFLTVHPADQKYAISSATSASGSAVWFDNAGSQVAALEYIIVYDASTATYYLRRVNTVATTSVTVTESISPALTTSDYVYSVHGSYQHALPPINSYSTGKVSIWCPQLFPTALTLDGNTTACKLGVSGVQSTYK